MEAKSNIERFVSNNRGFLVFDFDTDQINSQEVSQDKIYNIFAFVKTLACPSIIKIYDSTLLNFRGNSLKLSGNYVVFVDFNN